MKVTNQNVHERFVKRIGRHHFSVVHGVCTVPDLKRGTTDNGKRSYTRVIWIPRKMSLYSDIPIKPPHGTIEAYAIHNPVDMYSKDVGYEIAMERCLRILRKYAQDQINRRVKHFAEKYMQEGEI